jgi:acyl transferase domain-containing protein
LILLKTLKEAEKDNNRIIALIKGTATCSDGKV